MDLVEKKASTRTDVGAGHHHGVKDGGARHLIGMGSRGRRGQVTLEFFLIFIVVVTLTVLGATTFDDDIRETLESFFNRAAARITE